jgi:hypothetical protein
MTEPTFDTDGYPTEETLDVIRKWEYNSERGFADLLAYVRGAWKYGDEYVKGSYGGEFVYKYEMHTFGWSGNEDLIGALKDNTLFWALCWQESRRGGHYKFEAQLPQSAHYIGLKDNPEAGRS